MKVHVFVATTQGLVAIQNITAIDDADISSIVSINGTSTTANISSAYHNFVKKGAGIIQQDFGACSYRINISKRIDQGNSWQLAFYLAHAAKNENILGDGQVNVGDKVICATGEINTSSRDIQRIDQISLKQKLAATQIKQWHKQKISVSFLVPYDNAQELDKKLPLNIKHIRHLTQALTHLPSKALANLPQNEAKNKAQNKTQKETQNEVTPESASTINTATNRNRWFNKKSNVLLALVTLLLFLLLFLSMQTWWLADNPPLNNVSNKASQKLLIERDNRSTWQIVLLSKPENDIDQNLQPAYALIEKTLTEQLIANNFDIADTALITGTKNVTEHMLFQLTNVDNLNTPNSLYGINLAIRFNFTVNEINNSAEPTETGTDTWRYELSAYLIDLTTKRKIETHTEYGEYSKRLINCDHPCFSQWFATNAKKLAQDMGAILTIKLNNLPRRYQFELTFNDFLANELHLINDQLKEINGFVSSNLLQVFDTKKTLLHQTSSQKTLYSSNLPSDELTHHLDIIFKQLGLSVSKSNNNANNRAHSNTKNNINSLVFSRDNMPYFFHYIFSAVILTSLFVLLFFIQRKRRLYSASHNEYIDHKNRALEYIDHHTDVNKLTNVLNNIDTITEQEPTPQNTQPIQGAVIGQGALENCYIFTSNAITLGRLTIDPTTSFSIGYQQISRVGKQCIFSYENKTFYVTEQGSTNGSHFNNTDLFAQQKTAISQNSHLTLGGTTKDDIAPCKLVLKVASPQSTALIMQLDSSAHQFIDLNKVKLTWPSITKDLSSRWVLLAEEVSLSIDNGKVVLGGDKNDTIAYLVYQEGFYIRPNDTVTSEVMINQRVIEGIMPIIEGVIISLNGHEFSLQALSKS